MARSQHHFVIVFIPWNTIMSCSTFSDGQTEINVKFCDLKQQNLQGLYGGQQSVGTWVR